MLDLYYRLFPEQLTKEDIELLVNKKKAMFKMQRENIECYMDYESFCKKEHENREKIKEKLTKYLETLEKKKHHSKINKHPDVTTLYIKLYKIKKKCHDENPVYQEFLKAVKGSPQNKIAIAEKLLNQEILNEILVSCFHTEAEKALKEFATQQYNLIENNSSNW